MGYVISLYSRFFKPKYKRQKIYSVERVNLISTKLKYKLIINVYYTNTLISIYILP